MVTRTLKRNEKLFKVVGNSSYWGKFQWNFDQGKGNWVQVSGEFELSKFELLRFFCIEVLLYTTQIPIRYLTFLQVKRKLMEKEGSYHWVSLLSFHSFSYLESFERINFFGEDAEDVLSAGRPHTPVGGGSFSTHIPTVAAAGTPLILNCIPVFICCRVSSHKRPSNPFTSSGCMQELFS